MAVGSLTNLNAEKCSILKGRRVTLFPDLNGFEKWSNKAKELSHITRFMVSDLLERNATQAERKQGLDIVDYLIRFNYKDFLPPEIPIKPAIELLTYPNIEKPLQIAPIIEKAAIKPVYETYKKVTSNPQSSLIDITELQNWFNNTTLPPWPVALNQCSVITNLPAFIESHFATLKASNENKIFMPFLNRLQTLKNILEYET
jgi:hypothetical protein